MTGIRKRICPAGFESYSYKRNPRRPRVAALQNALLLLWGKCLVRRVPFCASTLPLSPVRAQALITNRSTSLLAPPASRNSSGCCRSQRTCGRASHTPGASSRCRRTHRASPPRGRSICRTFCRLYVTPFTAGCNYYKLTITSHPASDAESGELPERWTIRSG